VFIPTEIAWVVGRSFSWISRYRRLNTIVERTKEHLVAFVQIAFISILSRRLRRLDTQAGSARRLRTASEITGPSHLLRGHRHRFGSRTRTLQLRELSEDERTDVQGITRSHTLGARLVRPAQIIAHAMSGLKAEQSATRMDLCGNTVRYRLNRFNACGLDGLKEDVRTRRPPTNSAAPRRHRRRPDLPIRAGPALCSLDAGSPGRLSELAGDRYAPQSDQRDRHPRRPEVAPAGEVVRRVG